MSKKQQPKILVVDDQPINIKLLQRKLERQGMDVYVAYNGRECLDMVEETKPDLIESSIGRFKEEYEVEAEVVIHSSLESDARISANAETFEIVNGKLLINAWESYHKDTAAADRTIALKASIQRERAPPCSRLRSSTRARASTPKSATPSSSRLSRPKHPSVAAWA